MYCKKVREFTIACHDNIPNTPKMFSETQINFIHQMVNDELQELKEAKTLVDQTDALIDAIYYICDSAIRHGINLDPLFEIVHNANMGKVVNGKVIRREDGKILKPDTFIPPEPFLEKEMNRQILDGAYHDN